METLGQLLELKEWLTVAEAAQYLHRVLKENVSEADIFRFALNRKLALSVRFPTPVVAVQLPEKTSQRIAGGDREFDLTKEPDIEIVELPEGVYDLPMIGLERYVVEDAYRKLIGGPGVKIDDVFMRSPGPFVKSHETGIVFSLKLFRRHPFSSSRRPRDGSWRHMPSDSIPVVRPDALDLLVRRVPAQPEHLGLDLPATIPKPKGAEPTETSPRTPARPAVAKTNNLVGGPRLAAWLRAEMEKRELTRHRLHVLTQLDRKTIKRMPGRPAGPHWQYPQARAQGLSSEGPTCPLHDVPTT